MIHFKSSIPYTEYREADVGWRSRGNSIITIMFYIWNKRKFLRTSEKGCSVFNFFSNQQKCPPTYCKVFDHDFFLHTFRQYTLDHCVF